VPAPSPPAQRDFQHRHQFRQAMVDRRRCIAGRRCAYPGRMPVTVETTTPAEADEPAISVEAGEQMPEEDGHFPGDPFFELGLAPSIVDDIAAQGLTEPDRTFF
ncbi:MAG: hypothetical protein VX081_02100, partial [Pseudomonadota bacterium]|nr:hypothetical protein [Pseudomonadota bacterium]